MADESIAVVAASRIGVGTHRGRCRSRISGWLADARHGEHGRGARGCANAYRVAVSRALSRGDCWAAGGGRQ